MNNDIASVSESVEIDPITRLSDRELLEYNARALTAIHGLLAQGVSQMEPLLSKPTVKAALMMLKNLLPN